MSKEIDIIDIRKQEKNKGDFHSYSSYLAKWKRKGDTRFHSDICFSTIFRETNQYVIRGEPILDFNITVSLNISDKDIRSNNVCFLSEKQIKSWLNDLKKIVKFNYSLKYFSNMLYINISSDMLYGSEIKWILTTIRYLYEHPYSAILHLVFKLKEKYNNLEVENLYFLYNFIESYYYHGTGHSIISPRLLMFSQSCQQLSDRLKYIMYLGDLPISNYIQLEQEPKLAPTTVELLDTQYTPLYNYIKKHIKYININNMIKINKPELEKIKIYVVGGSNYYTSWIANHIIVDRLEDAEIMLFTGGEDVDPSLYGERKHGNTYSNIKRDNDEKELYNLSLNYDNIKLRLGICRGLN